jgi:hypothetical protein
MIPSSPHSATKPPTLPIHILTNTYRDFTPGHTHKSLHSLLAFLWQNNITTWPQLLLRASSSSTLFKPHKYISTLDGASDSLSVPIRLLAAVLTELLDTIHNRVMPITHPTVKYATPPTTIHPSWIALPIGYLERSRLEPHRRLG